VNAVVGFELLCANGKMVFFRMFILVAKNRTSLNEDVLILTWWSFDYANMPPSLILFAVYHTLLDLFQYLLLDRNVPAIEDFQRLEAPRNLGLIAIDFSKHKNVGASGSEDANSSESDDFVLSGSEDEDLSGCEDVNFSKSGNVEFSESEDEDSFD